ncbi:MAG TPA: hypothetical protein VIS96_17185 [Terrimicrobiaceae bacterium]
MSAAAIFGICAALLVCLGLFGLIVQPQPFRKILAFNILGSGAAGMGGDPIPQAMVITGIVVGCGTWCSRRPSLRVSGGPVNRWRICLGGWLRRLV